MLARWRQERCIRGLGIWDIAPTRCGRLSAEVLRRPRRMFRATITTNG